MAEIISFSSISEPPSPAHFLRPRLLPPPRLSVSLEASPQCPTYLRKLSTLSRSSIVLPSRSHSSISLNISPFIKYDNISYNVDLGKKKGTKSILNNVSGKIGACELTAILGPSGAGKTSLMDILSGYKDFVSNKKNSISGRISIGGIERNTKKFKKISCYVMQEDYMFPHFTITETMMLAANLELPDATHKEKEDVVYDILKILGLLDSQNTKVINLSGGQRKRLCIAAELIRDPLVIFLDEPTSGLDSSSSAQCVALLKSLANSGRTVICTIHQPSSKMFEQFDKLIVMGNGQCVYQGYNQDLIPFLTSLNFCCPIFYSPADYIISVISQDNGKYIPMLAEATKNSNAHDYMSTPDICTSNIPKNLARISISYWNSYSARMNSVDHMTSLWTQFRLLCLRSFKATFKNTMTSEIRILFHIFTGIMLGLLYYNTGNNGEKVLYNSIGLHFTQVFLLITCGMTVVIQAPLERQIIVREQINNWYRISAYYLAKVVADIPFQALCTISFATIFYWMTSQPSDLFRFFQFIAISVLTAETSLAFGFLFGAGASVTVAVCLCIFAAVPIVCFSGLLIRFKSIPSLLKWVTNFSFVGFAFNGIMLTIYGYNRQELDCPSGYCLFAEPQTILDEISIRNADVYMDIIGLLVTYVIFRIFAFFILRWKVRNTNL